jgi:translation elongation factor Ts
MAEITAALVKELRDITGAGMMACKKALTETAGDMDKAVEFLKRAGSCRCREEGRKNCSRGCFLHKDF